MEKICPKFYYSLIKKNLEQNIMKESLEFT